MKEFGRKTTELTSQSESIETDLEIMGKNLTALKNCDDEKAVSAMIEAKEHKKDPQIKQAQLDIEAARYKLKMTNRAIEEVKAKAHDRQDEIYTAKMLEEAAVIKKLLSDYSRQSNSMVKLMARMGEARDTYWAAEGTRSRHRGRLGKDNGACDPISGGYRQMRNLMQTVTLYSVDNTSPQGAIIVRGEVKK